MPKRSDGLCKCCLNGPEHQKGFLKYQFRTILNRKYFRFEDTDTKQAICVPIEFIDKLREDEWAYDSSVHTRRKDFLTCA